MDASELGWKTGLTQSEVYALINDDPNYLEYNSFYDDEFNPETFDPIAFQREIDEANGVVRSPEDDDFYSHRMFPDA